MSEISFAHIEALALLIEDSDWRPDFIVGIGRGGLAPGRFLSHRTNILMLSVDHPSKGYDFAEARKAPNRLRLAPWAPSGQT